MKKLKILWIHYMDSLHKKMLRIKKLSMSLVDQALHFMLNFMDSLHRKYGFSPYRNIENKRLNTHFGQPSLSLVTLLLILRNILDATKYKKERLEEDAAPAVERE